MERGDNAFWKCAVALVAGYLLSVFLTRSMAFAFLSEAGPLFWADCGVTTSVCGLVVTYNKDIGNRPLNHLQSLAAAVNTGQIGDVAAEYMLGPEKANTTLTTPADILIKGHDSQSVLLHELGHSIGLGHVNLGDRVLTANGNLDATILQDIPPASVPMNVWTRLTASTLGTNGKYEMNPEAKPGQDEVPGSADDFRGDDVGLHYVDADNNPFNLFIGNPIDSTTFSPGPHPQQASTRGVALDVFGVDKLESIMAQGSVRGERQRQLSYDDLFGTLYLEAGMDQRAGTRDDFRFNITYNPNAIFLKPGGANIMLSSVNDPSFLGQATPIFSRGAAIPGFAGSSIFPGGHLKFLHPWPGQTPPPATAGRRDFSWMTCAWQPWRQLL